MNNLNSQTRTNLNDTTTAIADSRTGYTALCRYHREDNRSEPGRWTIVVMTEDGTGSPNGALQSLEDCAEFLSDFRI